MIKRGIILFIFMSFFLPDILAQGILRGKVIDAGTGEALIGAAVVVTGTTKGTITDFDGNFTLTGLDPGITNITIQYISYESQIFPGVEINEGKITLLNCNLSEAVTQLDEVVVMGRATQHTEAALMVMQKKSATVIDGISAQQIGRLGDSDAASALKRVTGVSVEGGKYVYVRGLSDRYMKITLNGSQIPGLDPNRNTVQMDLFPANIIENMMVHKTYSPDLASFTGGHVDVITRDFPEKFTLKLSASAGINPQVHLHDNFISYRGGARDWLGFDDGTRDIPGNIRGIYLPQSINSRTIDTIYDMSRSFSKQYSNIRKAVLADQSYALSLGNQFNLAGKSLGVIGAVSYQDKYNFYENGRTGIYDAISKDIMQTFERLKETYGQNEVIWSSLINTALKLSNNHKIGLMYLRNQNGIKGSRYQIGYQSYDDKDVQKRVLEYLQRSLSSTQLKGKHVFPELRGTILEWQSSYTLSQLKEPDLRDFLNWFDVDTLAEPPDTSYRVFTGRDPRRRYRYMWEENWDNRADLSIPFSVPSGKAKLQLGGSFLYKHRVSMEQEYTIRSRGTPAYTGVPEEWVADENLLQPGKLYEGTYYTNDKLTNQTYSYTADEDMLGAYLMLDMPLIEKLRVVAGIRFEKDVALIRNHVDTIEFDAAFQKEKFSVGESDDKDLMPAVNLTYSLIENMNLRAAYSRTASRPAFRERAPYAFYDYDWGSRVNGNPDLKRGISDNLDLRWEYFFGPGEMVSFSYFFKYIRNPIERFQVQKEVDRIEYRNHTPVNLQGIEVELRKSLDFVPVLENFSFGTNITLIRSITDVDSTRYALASQVIPDFPETRPMFGQSPYIINAFLSYVNNEVGLASNLAFNVSGKKIILISKFATPDVHEYPYPRLDFNISKVLVDGISLKFSIDNVLDAHFRQLYELSGKDYVFRSHYDGRRYSLGFSYDIR